MNTILFKVGLDGRIQRHFMRWSINNGHPQAPSFQDGERVTGALS